MNVLLVEDHEDTLDAAVMILKSHGMTVETAASGAEALVKADAATPDVIVIELCLDGMHGSDVIRRLKASAATRRIPVVALSAHATFEDEESARAAGCDAFFNKPLQPQDLLTAIRTVHARAKTPSDSQRT